MVFLMVLLRIADYLQVEADRAPSASLKVRSLRNPVSIREWENHQCIHDVFFDANDQQAIFVVAEPSDAQTYLRVRALLDGLQRELDTSWAVLGEVYSRQEAGNDLGIKLRCVRSNLDDLTKLRSSVDYIPGRFAFESSGTGLLKNLVSPLYGDVPEVGIRELLQNAIDAVNERNGLPGQDRSNCGSGNSAPEVRIHIDGSEADGGSVTIEDRGVGMTEEVIRSYFLRVGASYRESDAWRKTDLVNGKPTVIRSGRFGIGVLAAFLLGDQIDVCTRHVSASIDEAMKFSATVDSEAIEVRKARRDFPGTTVQIRINGDTFRKLNEVDGAEWDWFRWLTPTVERKINGKVLPNLTRLPRKEDELALEWHRLEVPEFDDVIWTYGRAPNLVCNGLNIGSTGSSRGYNVAMPWEGQTGIINLDTPLAVPKVSVVDRFAKLPLDLQRFKLAAHRFPFAQQLLADATQDFCAYCLTFAPTALPPLNSFDWLQNYPGWHSGFPNPFTLSAWFYTNTGAGLCTGTTWIRLQQRRSF